MSHNELCQYCSDLQRAQRLFADQKSGVVLDVDINSIFRTIYRQKFDAEFYGVPYVSVFGEVA